MVNIIVTGAGSGLGLEFLKRYKRQEGNNIFAIDRQFRDDVKSDVDAIKNSSRIWWIEFDIADEGGMKDLVEQLQATLREHSASGRLDLVVHSAGVRGLVQSFQKTASDDVAKAETVDVMNKDTLMKTLEINAVGTFLLIKHLLPLLRVASTTSEAPSGSGLAKFIIMGSRMGSISANVAGGGYAYRASKAALNAIVTSFALDVKDVIFVTVHPGRVATGLCDGVLEDGAMSVDEVVPALMIMFDGFQVTDTGSFVDRFGKQIEW